MHPVSEPKKAIDFSIDMSIRQIAPKLGITGKALAHKVWYWTNKQRPTIPSREISGGQAFH